MSLANYRSQNQPTDSAEEAKICATGGRQGCGLSTWAVESDPMVIRHRLKNLCYVENLCYGAKGSHGRPKAAATAGCTSRPSNTFTAERIAALSRAAAAMPRVARSIT